MTVKQPTSYTDEAYAYAQARLLEAEVLRRARLPADQYLEWRPGLLLDAYDRAAD